MNFEFSDTWENWFVKLATNMCDPGQGRKIKIHLKQGSVRVEQHPADDYLENISLKILPNLKTTEPMLTWNQDWFHLFQSVVSVDKDHRQTLQTTGFPKKFFIFNINYLSYIMVNLHIQHHLDPKILASQLWVGLQTKVGVVFFWTPCRKTLFFVCIRHWLLSETVLGWVCCGMVTIQLIFNRRPAPTSPDHQHPDKNCVYLKWTFVFISLESQPKKENTMSLLVTIILFGNLHWSLTWWIIIICRFNSIISK